jgi:hypothetical protein
LMSVLPLATPWGGRDIRVAVELLELEPGEGRWGGRDYTGTLQEYTARGDDEAVRPALALVLAVGETRGAAATAVGTRRDGSPPMRPIWSPAGTRWGRRRPRS